MDYIHFVLNLTHFVIKGNYKYPLYGVKCNVGKLSNSTNLEELIVNYASIHGNISSLSNLRKLKIIQLMNCHVTGDIDAFSNNSNLTELTAPLHEISGSLSSLSGLTQLEKLDLTDSRVTGNIADLTNLDQLSIIYLDDCDIYGNLSTIPISCIEFNSKGNSTPFTWSTTNPRHNRSAQINNTLQYAKPFSIPGLIEMQSCADVENLLYDMSQCQGSITDGVIHLRVIDENKSDILFDSEWNQLNVTANSLSNALAAKGFISVEIKGRGDNKITII